MKLLNQLTHWFERFSRGFPDYGGRSAPNGSQNRRRALASIYTADNDRQTD
jgi:hypothetical protein